MTLRFLSILFNPVSILLDTIITIKDQSQRKDQIYVIILLKRMQTHTQQIYTIYKNTCLYISICKMIMTKFMFAGRSYLIIGRSFQRPSRKIYTKARGPFFEGNASYDIVWTHAVGRLHAFAFGQCERTTYFESIL